MLIYVDLFVWESLVLERKRSKVGRIFAVFWKIPLKNKDLKTVPASLPKRGGTFYRLTVFRRIGRETPGKKALKNNDLVFGAARICVFFEKLF